MHTEWWGGSKRKTVLPSSDGNFLKGNEQMSLGSKTQVSAFEAEYRRDGPPEVGPSPLPVSSPSRTD